jgi:hypothetical protein
MTEPQLAEKTLQIYRLAIQQHVIKQHYRTLEDVRAIDDIGRFAEQKLKSWLRGGKPHLLWVQGGRPGDAYPTKVSHFVAGMVKMLVKEERVVSSYFCQVGHERREEEKVMSVVYSLISDFLSIAPNVNLRDDVDEIMRLLGELDGELATFDFAIKILEIFIKHCKGQMWFVIDGVDFIDFGKARSMLQQLLDILRRRCVEGDETQSGLHVLFTSNGYSKTLDGIKDVEVLYLESWSDIY